MGKAPKGVGKPQLPACASWWEEAAEPPEGAAPPSADARAALRARADEAYTRECEAFGAARAKSHGASDRKLMQKLLTSGTQKDRVAALVVQAHESSFHSLPWVRQLVGLAQRPRPELKLQAVEALAQLFVQRLLPERPLKPWARQRLAAAPTPAALLAAHFEDGLKEAYGALIAVVTAGMGDTLTHVKQAMIKTAHAMLDAKPEGERLLLPALVNKLGDPERKVASRLTHLLGLLVRSHPAMKPLVVAEVQKFVLRPNAPERAQYYACVFLNQLVLTRREAPTAHRLLLVYLSLFGAATRRGDNGGGGDTKGPNLAARLSAAKAAVPNPTRRR